MQFNSVSFARPSVAPKQPAFSGKSHPNSPSADNNAGEGFDADFWNAYGFVSGLMDTTHLDDILFSNPVRHDAPSVAARHDVSSVQSPFVQSSSQSPEVKRESFLSTAQNSPETMRGLSSGAQSPDATRKRRGEDVKSPRQVKIKKEYSEGDLTPEKAETILNEHFVGQRFKVKDFDKPVKERGWTITASAEVLRSLVGTVPGLQKVQGIAGTYIYNPPSSSNSAPKFSGNPFKTLA